MVNKKLTILQINDTHGYLEEHQEMFWDAAKTRHEKIGGFAKISGYFNQIRRERGAESERLGVTRKFDAARRIFDHRDRKL